ncbi:MAG: hypothetical protein KDD55_11545 [Bdellovibrionales bacterium]|nr:hypothetical protein [Bdellovibrionales bacterium]
MKFISLTLSLVLVLFPTTTFAEVTSQSCPYSCKSRGLSHDHCKDWKQGNTCFVDDLKPGKVAAQASDLERNIVMVNKNILAGKSIEIQLPNNNPVDHLDAVVRRNGGSSQTQLTASLGGAIEFGTKQVDNNENHVIQFSAYNTRAQGRRLVLAATSGDVFVESVHVMTR